MKRFVHPMFLLVLLFAGCQRRDPTATNPFHHDDTRYVLLVAIQKDFVNHEPQFEFLSYALSTYFSEREEGTDQVIVSVLGSKKPVLWQGEPKQFKTDFPTPNDFRLYLESKSSDQLSDNVNENLAFSLDYLSRHPSVSSGSARSVTLVISSMLGDDSKGDEKAVESLIRYSKTGGAIGFYWVDQTKFAFIEDELLKKAGITMYTLQCDVYGRPPLPSFED